RLVPSPRGPRQPGQFSAEAKGSKAIKPSTLVSEARRTPETQVHGAVIVRQIVSRQRHSRQSSNRSITRRGCMPDFFGGGRWEQEQTEETEEEYSIHYFPPVNLA